MTDSEWWAARRGPTSPKPKRKSRMESLFAVFIGVFIIYGACLIYEIKSILDLLK